jgi:hypothetical protein
MLRRGQLRRSLAAGLHQLERVVAAPIQTNVA